MEDTTYITGYWKVPNYKKHNFEYYYESIRQTMMRLKNHNVVFFYMNDDILNIVRKIKPTNNIIFIKINIIGLPTWNISEVYLESCKSQNNQLLNKYNPEFEKGLMHYKREYMQGGEDVYRKVFTIWTSKLYLIEQIIHMNPYNTKNFTWIDAGLGNRIGNFLNVKNYKNDCINGLNKSRMKYFGEKIIMIAYLMISDKDTWLKIIPLYKEELELHKNSNYAHDEETILHLLYKKFPVLFNPINVINFE